MEKNCLQVTLKESTGDVYQPKLDELLFVIPANKTILFAFGMAQDDTNTILRPTLKVVSGTAVFSNDSGSTVYGPEGFTMWYGVVNYFKIVTTTEIVFSVSNCSSLSRATDMNNYIENSICVDALLSIVSMKILSIDGNSVITFEQLSDSYPNLETLFANSTALAGGKSGDFSSLGKCIKLTTLALQNNSKATGTIENFAQTAINAGRTTGTCTITCNGKITYNNAAVANNSKKKITFSSGSYTVEDVA